MLFRSIHRGDVFTTAATLGPIGISGYVLVISNEHYNGIAGMPEEFDGELDSTVRNVKNLLLNEYNSGVVVFEHGPRIGEHSGGTCIDHTHLHFVPTNINLVKILSDLFDFVFSSQSKFSSYNDLREILRRNESSYLFIEDQKNRRFILETAISLPSQFLRRVIAFGEGRDDWDYAVYPERDLMYETVKRLRRNIE